MSLMPRVGASAAAARALMGGASDAEEEDIGGLVSTISRNYQGSNGDGTNDGLAAQALRKHQRRSGPGIAGDIADAALARSKKDEFRRERLVRLHEEAEERATQADSKVTVIASGNRKSSGKHNSGGNIVASNVARKRPGGSAASVGFLDIDALAEAYEAVSGTSKSSRKKRRRQANDSMAVVASSGTTETSINTGEHAVRTQGAINEDVGQAVANENKTAVSLHADIVAVASVDAGLPSRSADDVKLPGGMGDSAGLLSEASGEVERPYGGLCRFWARGACRRADDCAFVHSEELKAAAPRSFYKTKTRSRQKNIKRDTRPAHLRPTYLNASGGL